MKKRNTFKFYDFIQVLDENGWAIFHDYDVESQNGEKGHLYKLAEYSSDNKVAPVSWEVLKGKIEKAAGDNMPFIDFVNTKSEYAPEIIHKAVVFLQKPKKDDKTASNMNGIALRLADEENGNTTSTNQYNDISLLVEGNSVFLYMPWTKFSIPIWVNRLKEEIQDFETKCHEIIKGIGEILPQNQFVKHIESNSKHDAFYEWEWNDEWIYTGIIILQNEQEVKKVIDFCTSKGIAIDKKY